MVERLLNPAKRLRQRLKGRGASPLEVERAEQKFYIDYLQEGMVAFDVGANIGEISLLFARFVGCMGKVHSFEATQTTFAKLSTICHAANRPQIQLNHCAVADRVGTMMFHQYEEAYADWNTLAQRPLQDYGIDIQPARQQEVKAITLDQYCQEQQIARIDLLKIDVEGAEYQVMLGARDLFQSHRIGACVFEFGATTFDMGNQPAQIAQFFQEMGYRLQNLIKFDPIFPGQQSARTAQFSLHLATPKR